MASALSSALVEMEHVLGVLRPALRGLHIYARCLEVAGQDTPEIAQTGIDVAEMTAVLTDMVETLTAVASGARKLTTLGYPDPPKRTVIEAVFRDLVADSTALQAALGIFQSGGQAASGEFIEADEAPL